jgi:hypothetical protein
VSKASILDGDDAAAAMHADWAASEPQHGQTGNGAAAATTGTTGSHAAPSLDDIMDAVCRKNDNVRHAVALHLDSVHDRVHDSVRLRRAEAESMPEHLGVDLAGRERGSAQRAGLETIPSGRPLGGGDRSNDEDFMAGA